MGCCNNTQLFTITTLVRTSCGQSGCGSCNGSISPSVKVDAGGNTVVTFTPSVGCQSFKAYVDGIETPFSNDRIKLTNISQNHVVEICYSGLTSSVGTVISSACSTTQCRKRINVVAGAGCTTTNQIVDDNTCTVFSACCGTLGFSACCGQPGFPSCPVPCSEGCYNPNTGLCSSTCPTYTTCVNGICLACGANGQPACTSNTCSITPCTNGCNRFTVLNTTTSLCQVCGGIGQLPCPNNDCPTPICTSGCNAGLSYNSTTGLCSNCPTVGTLDGCECGSNCAGGIAKCRLRYNDGACGFTYVNNVNCSDYQSSCNVAFCSATIPCPTCGGLNQDCCLGTTCGAGMSCQPFGATTSCRACGTNGTPPCPTCQTGPCNCTVGSTNCCNNGLSSQGGVCLNCGGNGQPACINCGSAPCTNGCDSGLILQPSGRCCPSGQTWNGTNCSLPCGESGQPPCATSCPTGPCNCLSTGSLCCNTGLVSINGTCTACGQNGQPTCVGSCSGSNVASTGYCCLPNEAFNGSSCTTCGNLNQIPCTTGTPCLGGLANNGSSCISLCVPYGTEISRVCSGVCNTATVTYANGTCGTYLNDVIDYGCTAGCGEPVIQCRPFTFCGTCAQAAGQIGDVYTIPSCSACNLVIGENEIVWDGLQHDACQGWVPAAGTITRTCSVTITNDCSNPQCKVC